MIVRRAVGALAAPLVEGETSAMRQWDYLFVGLDRSSMLIVNRDLKVRSVNDEEQEN